MHSKPPANYCLSAALYYPAIPRTVPVALLSSFVFISVTETGTVVDWLLGNVAVLHISKCTAANINCCGLVVMQYGGSTHQ